MTSILEYTHSKLNEDSYAIAGYYSLEKEVRLKYNNREVLYVVGQAVIESSCCGTGGCRYALVPGYIVNWQNRTNEADLPVSEVEPISDKEQQKNITRIIKEAEVVSQVDFWGYSPD